ncbi:MAG TPA: hypothetical protein PKI03_22330 [Pseudomonadota bacterium]|nr:hypothetical protein [Pseudomonadota bacterium]
MRTRTLGPVSTVVSAGLLFWGNSGQADPHRSRETTATTAAAPSPGPSRAPSEDQLPRLRPVLRGVLYRSGTPSEEALTYLCESGWKRVYSLYGEFTTHMGPKNVNMLRHGRDQRECVSSEGPRQIEWRPAPSSRMRNLPTIFQDVIDSIRNPDRGPVLVHCWNGLHYAGMVSALALRQFCGLSPQQAEAYWRANANRGANYPLIIANLYSFKPLPNLTLTQEEQQSFCPNLAKGYLVTPDAFPPLERPLDNRNENRSTTVASNAPVPGMAAPTAPAYLPATRDPRAYQNPSELPASPPPRRVKPAHSPAPFALPSQSAPAPSREATGPSAPAKG